MASDHPMWVEGWVESFLGVVATQPREFFDISSPLGDLSAQMSPQLVIVEFCTFGESFQRSHFIRPGSSLPIRVSRHAPDPTPPIANRLACYSSLHRTTKTKRLRMSQLAQDDHKTLVGAQVGEELREQLIALVRREDRSLASVVRRALERELERAQADEGDRT